MKVLIIQTAFLGDLVLTLPLVQEIKNKTPDAKISMLVIPGNYEITSNSPSIDSVITFDKKGSQKSLFEFLKLAFRLMKQNFDVIYCPHRSFRSALLAFIAKPRSSVGFDRSAGSFFFKSVIKYNPDAHEVERNLSLLGNYSENDRWKILPAVESKGISEKIILRIGEPKHNNVAAVAPGSVWQTKKYPFESFVEVTKSLVEKGWKICVVGGGEDFDLGEKLAKISSDVINFCGRLTVTESIELLRNCKFLFSNDSAPTHLAMAADIPAVTIYCSTIPKFGFYPYNSRSISLSYDNLSCKPCGIHGNTECPTGTFECAERLPPETVIKSVENLFPNIS